MMLTFRLTTVCRLDPRAAWRKNAPHGIAAGACHDGEITSMKRISSLSDLAIHGAPPAFAQPLHVGRPNLGSREAFLRYANDIFDRRWFINIGPLMQQLDFK